MTNIFKFAALCLVLIAVLPAVAQNDDAAANITKMIQDGVKADLAGDNSQIKNNFVDDYIVGSSLGNWMTKNEMMDTSKNTRTSESINDIKVNVYGDTAIARFRQTYAGLVQGTNQSRTIICTQTWQKQGNAWKGLATHCSKAQ